MISKFEWSSLSHLSFYPQMTLRKDFALMHMINTPSPIVRTSGGLWTLQSNPHFHTLSKYRVGYLSFRISFLIWSLRQLVGNFCWLRTEVLIISLKNKMVQCLKKYQILAYTRFEGKFSILRISVCSQFTFAKRISFM